MAIGIDQDEDEKFRQMLGGIIGSGPAPYDVTTSMEQPAQQQLSAPFMPQSSAGGFSGYTPPPAAAPPQYLDHVQGHQFGAGDIAMLGGILAALLGGGKHRGEIAGSLAGQYGGAMMQANARADQRNQQVDQYNSQLAAKDDPLDRWKADMMGKQAVGNLKARGDELALQKSREERIAAAQAAEDAKDPVEQARLIEEARSQAILDRKRQENDMDVGTREMLGLILGKQKAQFAAPGGKGADDPVKLLKKRQAQAALDGIDDGTVDPLTGKPREQPEKPLTPTEQRKRADEDLLREPVGETEMIPGRERDWQAQVLTPGNRDKIRIYEQGVNQTIRSLQKMKEIRDRVGPEMMGQDKSTYDSLLTAAIGGYTQIGQSGVLNGGEFARYKDFIPGIGPKASDLLPGDNTSDELQGVIDATKRLAGDGLGSVGLRFKSKPVGGGAQQKAGPQSGFGAPPSDSGTRTVTVTMKDGRKKTGPASAAMIAELQNDPDVESVQ